MENWTYIIYFTALKKTLIGHEGRKIITSRALLRGTDIFCWMESCALIFWTTQSWDFWKMSDSNVAAARMSRRTANRLFLNRWIGKEGPVASSVTWFKSPQFVLISLVIILIYFLWISARHNYFDSANYFVRKNKAKKFGREQNFFTGASASKGP